MYNKVIVAIDLSEESLKVIKKAITLVDGETEKLVLIHVVEPIPAEWGVGTYSLNPIEEQQRIVDNASTLLKEIALKNGISPENQQTILGSPATEVRSLALRKEADAIVIGSHGRSGWKLMLGATANKLLHGATCDVLTIYVGDR